MPSLSAVGNPIRWVDPYPTRILWLSKEATFESRTRNLGVKNSLQWYASLLRLGSTTPNTDPYLLSKKGYHVLLATFREETEKRVSAKTMMCDSPWFQNGPYSPSPVSLTWVIFTRTAGG